MSSNIKLTPRAVVWLMIVSLTISYAQERAVSLKGYFQVDSTSIGLPTPFVLVVSYPLNYEVFLPDSTHDFSPFEWSHMTYDHSKLRSAKACDSIIYYVSPFTLDSVQSTSSID